MAILAEIPPGYYGATEDWSGPPVVRCWERSKATALRNVQWQAEKQGLGILHWQYDPNFFPPKTIKAYAEWAEWHGIRTVVTVHVLVDIPVFAWTDKAICRHADQIVAGTPALRQAWQDYAQRFNIPLRRPVAQVPLPAPISFGVRPEKLGPGPVILTWGMLGHGKGHRETYEAVCRLRRGAFPDAKYLIVGQALTGEQHDNLEELQRLEARSDGALEVRNLFLDEHGLYRLCASVDAIVLNHQWQHPSSSGTVALSVMSGTPVVVSRSPMFSGYIECGAVKVAKPWARGLAAAIESVLWRPEQLVAGRRQIVPQITGYAVAMQYENLYRMLESSY